MKDHMRVPVMNVYRKSPFEGVLEHASKIKECLNSLQKGVYEYVDGNYETAEKHFNEVQELESEADRNKANTRNHLPKFIFLPVDRGDVLKLLRSDDRVLDFAEDVAVLLRMRRTEIPDDMKDEFRGFADRIVQTGESMERTVENLRNLLETSFSDRERNRTKEMIRRVHKLEYECDRYQERLTKYLLNTEMDPIAVLHLMKVVERLGQIADAAENAVDQVRVLMGR